jgi:hypothetical protein
VPHQVYSSLESEGNFDQYEQTEEKLDEQLHNIAEKEKQNDQAKQELIVVRQSVDFD